MSKKPLITVFGSHAPVPGSPEYKEAEELGAELAKAGFRVGSGGYGGIMEAVLKGAGGGKGFTVEIIKSKPNKFVKEEECSANFFDRINQMINQSAAVICLKGGTGTLLELSACWEFVNKKMVPFKPIICLGEFWKNVVKTLEVEPTVDNLSSLKSQSKDVTSYILFAKSAKSVSRYLQDIISMK
jgi:uncharacterized protein (TIGR00725 family)